MAEIRLPREEREAVNTPSAELQREIDKLWEAMMLAGRKRVEVEQKVDALREGLRQLSGKTGQDREVRKIIELLGVYLAAQDKLDRDLAGWSAEVDHLQDILELREKGEMSQQTAEA